jgi:endonuclease/exonuclease/phosphatase family metal-dependent hydrolase
VVTFNVLAWEHASGPERHEVIRRGLAELRPDIVALQEVTRTPERNQAVQLLGAEFTILDHPGRSPNGVGACVASRWPLGRANILDLHISEEAGGLPWAAALATEVLAPPPFGRLLIVHHKPNWQLDREHLREQQALTAACWVEDLVSESPDMPVVVLGDFDAAPDAASIRFWTGRQSLDGKSVRYEDAWEATRAGEPGHTFAPHNPLVPAGEMPLERGRRIDYVLVRSGSHGPLLNVESCRLIFDQPVDDVWASDHFGLVADLTPPPHPTGRWT